MLSWFFYTYTYLCFVYCHIAGDLPSREKFCGLIATHKSFSTKFRHVPPTYTWFSIPRSFLRKILTSYWSTKVFSLEYFMLLYSGKFSGEKIFTYFAILQPPAKVFSTKCSLPTNQWKFSPLKVSHNMVYSTCMCSSNGTVTVSETWQLKPVIWFVYLKTRMLMAKIGSPVITSVCMYDLHILEVCAHTLTYSFTIFATPCWACVYSYVWRFGKSGLLFRGQFMKLAHWLNLVV